VAQTASRTLAYRRPPTGASKVKKMKSSPSCSLMVEMGTPLRSVTGSRPSADHRQHCVGAVANRPDCTMHLRQMFECKAARSTTPRGDSRSRRRDFLMIFCGVKKGIAVVRMGRPTVTHLAVSGMHASCRAQAPPSDAQHPTTVTTVRMCCFITR
jgi:hypothetical protein